MDVSIWPAMIWIVALPFGQMVNDRRWSGELGRARLLALDPISARDVREAYRRNARPRRTPQAENAPQNPAGTASDALFSARRVRFGHPRRWPT